jgi:DNA-binding CsgD family transcriptional regulator/tetratricopeptide (TPR) repeat protein
VELLERENYFKELEDRFNNLSDRGGFIVFVSGEAGIGKTSLVENFTEKIADKANVLWGACDALFTPRPLGPLYDIASQLKNGLSKLLNNQSPRAVIFNKFLEELQHSKVSNIVIIEDAHWADESTLDLIKFLGRRIKRINSLFIITYRDDEIGSGHSLRLVLGDIPSNNLIKLKLPPLNENTVNSIAVVHGIKNLYEITVGNPFLISELLNSKDESIPTTVKDSILTRISRLSDKARDLIELVSIIPTRAERWLLGSIKSSDPETLDECLNSGILISEEGTISFRHELSRMAAEESLTESKRYSLNESVLRALLKQEKIDNYLARIIHHATVISDKEIIIKYSPRAAKQASDLGAHLLAANHYLNALKFVDDLALENQLELYEGRAYECYLTEEIEEGIKACKSIIEIMKKYSDPLREGENYRRLSRLLWFSGQEPKSLKYLFKAVEILEGQEPSKQLAMTYSNLSQIYLCREDTELCVKWGEKAIQLAKKMNDLETEAHSLITIGSRIMCGNDDSGKSYMDKGLELSLENGFHEEAARTYNNLGSTYLWRRNLSEAEKYFSLGLKYCNEKDIESLAMTMLGDLARTKLFMCKWDDAVETANLVLKKENISLMNKIIPLYVIGIIRTRRDDPGATTIINELNCMISDIGEVWEMIVTVKAAVAEASWIQNKLEDVLDDIELSYNKIKDKGNLWVIGELAYWLWKGDRLTEISERIAKPFLLQIKGDWKSAATLWKELHCPYEEALALSEGNEKSMKDAIKIFDRLGASATLQNVKQKMRESGIKSVPKGPRKTTRENLAGLTTRQLEVLNLLDKGLSNTEIGNKLYISPKTVDHHISAILSKLNVHSRHEAAVFVRSNGINIK